MTTTFSEHRPYPMQSKNVSEDSLPVLRHACSMLEISDFNVLQCRSHDTANRFQSLRLHNTSR